MLGLLVLLLRVLHVHEGRVGIGLLGVRIREGRFVTDDIIIVDFFIFFFADLPQGMLVHGFLLGWQRLVYSEVIFWHSCVASH